MRVREGWPSWRRRARLATLRISPTGNKLGTWRTAAPTMKSRLVELEASSNSSGVDTPADTRIAAMRFENPRVETRIKELKSRADNLMDMITGEQMS